MENKLLAQRWAESTYNVDSLLAYSAFCETGLDTIPLPGDISIDQVERIFGDVASLATNGTSSSLRGFSHFLIGRRVTRPISMVRETLDRDPFLQETFRS